MNTFVPEILGYEEAVLKDGKNIYTVYSKMAFILTISICIYLYISLNNYFLFLIQLGPYMFVNRHSFIAFFFAAHQNIKLQLYNGYELKVHSLRFQL